MDRHSNFGSAAGRLRNGGAARCQHTLALLLASGSEFCPQCLAETLSGPGLATHKIISARFFLDTLRSDPDLCRLVAAESHYLLAGPLVQAVASSRDEELAATLVDLVVFLTGRGSGRGGRNDPANVGDDGLLLENLVRAVAVEIDRIPVASSTPGHCFLLVLLGKLLTVACNRHSALPASLAQQSGLWGHVVDTLHKQTQDRIRAESLFVLYKLCSLPGGMQLLDEKLPGIVCAGMAILLSSDSSDVSSNCVGLLSALASPPHPPLTLASLPRLDRPEMQPYGTAAAGLGSQGAAMVGSQIPRASQAMQSQGKEPLGLRVMLCEGLKKALLAADPALQLAALQLISHLTLSCAPSDDGDVSDGRSGFDWMARELWEEQEGVQGGEGGERVDERGAVVLQAMLEEGLAEHVFELLRSTDTGLVADPLVPAALSCLANLAASPGAGRQAFAQRFVFGFDTLSSLLHNAIAANDYHLQTLAISVFLHSLHAARSVPRGPSQFPSARLQSLASAVGEVLRRFCLDGRERKRWVLDQKEAAAMACLALALLAAWPSVISAECMDVLRLLERCVADAASVLATLQDFPSGGGSLAGTGGKASGGSNSAALSVVAASAAAAAGGDATSTTVDSLAQAVLTFLHACARRFLQGASSALCPAAGVTAVASTGAAALASSQQDPGLLAMVGGSQGAPVFHSSQQEFAGRAAAAAAAAGLGKPNVGYMQGRGDKGQGWGGKAACVAPLQGATALECCVEDLAAALMTAADIHVAPFMLSLHPQPQSPSSHMHTPLPAAAGPFSDPAAILSRAYDVLSHVLACSLPLLAPVTRQFAAKLASSWTLSLVFSSLQAFHIPSPAALPSQSWLPQHSAAPQASQGSSKWQSLRRASLRFAVLLSAVAATGEEGRPPLQWLEAVTGLERMPWAVGDMLLLLAEGRGERGSGGGRRDVSWRHQVNGGREGGGGVEEELQAVQWVVLLMLYAAVRFEDRVVEYEDMFGALQNLVLSNRIPPLASPLPTLSTLALSPHHLPSESHLAPPTSTSSSSYFFLVFLSLHALLRPLCMAVSFEAEHRLLRFLHTHAAALSFPLAAWHVALPHWILQQGGLEDVSRALVRSWLFAAAAALQPPAASAPPASSSLPSYGDGRGVSKGAAKGADAAADGAAAAGVGAPELDALGSLLCHDTCESDERSNDIDAWNREKEEEEGTGRWCALVVAEVVREMWRARNEWQQLVQVTHVLGCLVDRHSHICVLLEQGGLSTMYVEAMLLSGSQLPRPLLLTTLHLLARLLTHLPPKPPAPQHAAGRLQPPPQQATAWERLAQQVLIVVEPLVRPDTAAIGSIGAAANALSQPQQQQQQQYSQTGSQPQVRTFGDDGGGAEQGEGEEKEQVLLGVLNVVNALIWQATQLYEPSATESSYSSHHRGGGGGSRARVGSAAAAGTVQEVRSGGGDAVRGSELHAVMSANMDVLEASVTVMSSEALIEFVEACIAAAAGAICGTGGGGGVDGLAPAAVAAVGGSERGGTEACVGQARGSGGVWQGYSYRVLLASLTFFNLRVSWMHALEATSTLPSGIPPLHLSSRFTPPSPAPAAAAAGERAQQECPPAVHLASACDFAAILLAAAAGQLPAAVELGDKKGGLDRLVRVGNGRASSSGCAKASGNESTSAGRRGWARRVGGYASMQDAFVAADLASRALLSCLSSLALLAPTSSPLLHALPPSQPAPANNPGQQQQEGQQSQSEQAGAHPSPLTPPPPALSPLSQDAPSTLPSLPATILWPITAALQHAASCPHPPVHRNTCLALSLLLRCFHPLSVARPISASPWTRLLLDDALASITAAAAAAAAASAPAAAASAPAAATAGAASAGATTNGAMDGAAMRGGAMKPAGESESAQPGSSCCQSPSMLDLLLCHALESLHIAAACLQLASPTSPPQWLAHVFQPARVSALVGSLWRTRELSLPAIATCHWLIGAGLVPRSLMPQLLDLAQAHARPPSQQRNSPGTPHNSSACSSTGRLLWLSRCLVAEHLPIPAVLSAPCVVDPSLPATLPHQCSAFLALHSKLARGAQ